MRSSIQVNYILAGSGTLAFLACFYYLLRHGFDGPDAFASSSLFSVPMALAAFAVSCFAGLLVRPTAKIALVGLYALTATGAFAADAVLAREGLASSGTPVWSFDSFSSPTRKEVAKLARPFGVDVDVMSRSEKVEELRGRGLDAAPALLLASVQTGGGSLKVAGDDDESLIPLGGISNTVTVLCNETGQFVTYTSDEHGFRNPAGMWTSPRLDLVALGQSQTQGYCVPDGTGLRRSVAVPVSLHAQSRHVGAELAAATRRHQRVPADPATQERVVVLYRRNRPSRPTR